MQPRICEPQSVTLPDNCDDCTVSCEDFYQYQAEVAEALDKKQDKLTPGEHITITTNEDGETVIDATGAFTKEELLATLGYEEVEYEMEDKCGEVSRWKVLAKPLNPTVITLFDGVPTEEDEVQTPDVSAEEGDLITVTITIAAESAWNTIYDGEGKAGEWETVGGDYTQETANGYRIDDTDFYPDDIVFEEESTIGKVELEDGTTIELDFTDGVLSAVRANKDFATFEVLTETEGGEITGTATKSSDTVNVCVNVGDYMVTVHAEDGVYTLVSIGDEEVLPDNMTVTVTKYE